MTKIQMLVVMVLLGVTQLWWLIAVWRKHGFFATLKLFLYGALVIFSSEFVDLYRQQWG